MTDEQKKIILQAIKGCSEITNVLKMYIPDLFPKTYQVGQRFIEDHGDEYILARTSIAGTICLISLVTGNRYIDPIVVENSIVITEDEIKHMSGGCGHFKLK